MRFKIYTILILFLTASSCLIAQDFLLKAKKEISIGATGSTTGLNPFWMRSNVYGTVPLESNYGTIGGRISNDYDSTYTLTKKLKKFNWGYGIETLANLGSENKVYLPELYGKVRYGAFEIYIGKRKEVFGLVDSTLSSGSFSWSGNAMPLPKIQLSIPNYIKLDRQGLLSIKGGYAHGYFDNDRQYTRNVKLHQKWAYAKLGKANWKVNMFAGFNHQVMWGGQSPFFSRNGQLPDGLKNYKYVILGTRGAIADPLTSNFDENRVGNHLGSIDVGAILKTKIAIIEIYRQSFYEDGSLFFLLNIKDGLNGLSVKTNIKVINKICFEYLNTSDQGGGQFIISNEYLRGGDSYYWNGQYADGYTNRDKILGTPFIQMKFMNWGIKNENNQIFITNSRVKLFHLATYGRFRLFEYNLKMSQSQNLGGYGEGVKLNQFSYSQNLTYNLIKTSMINSISFKFAVDAGKLYPNCIGFNLNLSKKL